MLRVVVIILLLLAPSAALAQKRVALVIGNGAYTRVAKLPNPANDAAAMEKMFKSAGFDVVVRSNDLDLAGMRRALRDFSDVARDVDVAVLFYAGHGIEVGGVNYLIPVDAALDRDTDAPDEAISLERVNQLLEPVKRLRLIILDACRDNPFARSMRRTASTRSVRSGYGEIDERSLMSNTLVAYAQRAGATAEDGQGTNSPYTTALVKHLPTPGLDVELALRRVRDEVLRSTKGRQEPFKYGSLGGAEIALQPATGALPSFSQASEAARICREVEGMASLSTLGVLEQQHRGSPAGDCVKARIAEIQKQSRPVSAPQPAPRTAEVAPQRDTCIVVGTRIARPILVKKGAQLCGSPDGVRATINDVTSFEVVYSVPGWKQERCQKAETCTFYWDGAPKFSIDVVEGPEGRSAYLVGAR